jgi:hypothetical protein
MNYNQIILDSFFGALILGLFSYFTQLYSNEPYYIRIIGFMWAMPTLYFYFLLIASRTNKQTMFDFTIHGLIGLLLTLFAMLCTYLLKNSSKEIIILFNLIYLALITLWYFQNKIYLFNKIII